MLPAFPPQKALDFVIWVKNGVHLVDCTPFKADFAPYKRLRGQNLEIPASHRVPKLLSLLFDRPVVHLNAKSR